MRIEHRERGPGFTHFDSPDCGCQPIHILVSFDYPPVPWRHDDWSAVEDGYEPGDPIGRGATEDEAIASLLEQIEERAALRERMTRSATR